MTSPASPGSMPQAPIDDPTLLERIANRYHTYSKKLIEAPHIPLGEFTVTASVKTFLEKRASLQSTTKTAAPGLGSSIIKHLMGEKNPLLLGSPLIGLGELGKPMLQTWGNRLNTELGGSLSERANMPVEFAKSYAQGLGKQLSISTVGLFNDMFTKGLQVPTAMLQSRASESIFKTLKREDDVIGQADPKQLLEAYHTMVRFAPTLSTDKNAVKTFLRESVLYGTGPNFMSLKQLADAERAVTDLNRIPKTSPRA